jgi:hypothetical protein
MSEDDRHSGELHTYGLTLYTALLCCAGHEHGHGDIHPAPWHTPSSWTTDRYSSGYESSCFYRIGGFLTVSHVLDSQTCIWTISPSSFRYKESYFVYYLVQPPQFMCTSTLYHTLQYVPTSSAFIIYLLFIQLFTHLGS